ncbi:Gldg family protein [Mucilaginibacter sp. UR6-1]|uniref:Gldg family protein n=1 Tax=Mucilaginibacter sp. UR6-1 TaxID=1435643 RepID=UPI001E5F847B|nr:Gldg family protein [Mucilaginibacter sp. UR6-1]MCC8411260.1 Gldg family protein [Mucilaginibacter sp. UR6-1]
MKNILRIARIELSQLFLSPVAWIVLIVFIVQSGWQYMSMLERLEQAQQMGQSVDGITERIFAGFRSLYPNMKDYLYLYIPLLTMGLISRETHSGSIKLLYSSPIRVMDIVLGKYLAMAVYSLLLMGVLFGLGMISLFTIKSTDLTFIISGIIGLYLLVCAYSAIGLFMSSLTSYQVVAAISTLVVLAILNFIGGLWQDVDFVRDITYFLSISGRTEEAINGLIGSNDVLYFGIVIALFIGLTLLKLQFERRTLPLGTKILQYACLISVMLLLGYISSLPQFTVYKDMTGNNRRTLTPPSQAVIAKFAEPVEITTYVNLLDENSYFGLPMYQNQDKKVFEPYSRFMPYMRLKYIYYWADAGNERLYKENPGLSHEQIARKLAKINELDFNMFLRPEQINKLIDLKPERYRSVRTIRYRDKITFLRIYDDLFRQPSEKEITAALKRLVVKPPVIGFVQGHRERSIERLGDRDYKVSTNEVSFRYALINQGFDVQAVSLTDPALKEKINVLVIADPVGAYNDEELSNLRSFIDAGGNVMIAAEPGSQSITNPILKLVDVKLEDGSLVQKSENFEPSFVMSGVALKNWIALLGQSNFTKLDSPFVTTPTAAALSVLPNTPFTTQPVLVTQAANTWQIAQVALDKTTEIKDIRLNDQKKSYPVAFALKRRKNDREQRILVAGDADFMSNAEVMRQSPRSVNFTFVTEAFNWFSNGEFPIDTSRPQTSDNLILADSKELTILRWCWIGLLPAVIVLAVSGLLIFRKRR